MAATDTFSIYRKPILSSPIEQSYMITPDNSNDMANVSRAILVDVAGAVKVTYKTGVTDTLSLAAGVWHPMRVSRVWATGTTATGIHTGY